MFSILQAYGIFFTMLDTIMAMYVVITPDGVTDEFAINSGVLQLAALLFIVALNYALCPAMSLDDVLTQTL